MVVQRGLIDACRGGDAARAGTFGAMFGKGRNRRVENGAARVGALGIAAAGGGSSGGHAAPIGQAAGKLQSLPASDRQSAGLYLLASVMKSAWP